MPPAEVSAALGQRAGDPERISVPASTLAQPVPCLFQEGPIILGFTEPQYPSLSQVHLPSSLGDSRSEVSQHQGLPGML